MEEEKVMPPSARLRKRRPVFSGKQERAARESAAQHAEYARQSARLAKSARAGDAKRTMGGWAEDWQKMAKSDLGVAERKKPYIQLLREKLRLLVNGNPRKL